MKNVRRMSPIVLVLLVLIGCSAEDRRLRPVVLVPIGPVPGDVLEHLQRELPALVKREVVVAAALPLPGQALDPSRRQYRGSALLEELERHDVADADRILGIVDADAYAPGLNFIFGQARKPGRFAVLALPRLRESFRGRPEKPERFRQRVVKEATHELGHTFGFAHCENRHCVMHFSNSLGDTDYKSTHFCDRERLPGEL